MIRPILPANEKRHRYIWSWEDCATRYPEAVPLRSIKTETVAGASMDMYCRLGVPEEVLSNLGMQFVLMYCMEEVSQPLLIKRLTNTLYHPICNR